MRIFSGLVWRHVPHGANALHVGWILRAVGRWNRQGVYGCLYTALTSEGALAEYRKYSALARTSRHIDARDLVSIRVNRIGPVLDLTAVERRAEAGVDLHTLTSDEPDDLETCRTIRRLGEIGGVPRTARAVSGPVRRSKPHHLHRRGSQQH